MADEEKKETAQEDKPAAESKESKSWDKEIKKLGDGIVGLSLLQAKELGIISRKNMESNQQQAEQ